MTTVGLLVAGRDDELLLCAAASFLFEAIFPLQREDLDVKTRDV